MCIFRIRMLTTFLSHILVLWIVRVGSCIYQTVCVFTRESIDRCDRPYCSCVEFPGRNQCHLLSGSDIAFRVCEGICVLLCKLADLPYPVPIVCWLVRGHTWSVCSSGFVCVGYAYAECNGIDRIVYTYSSMQLVNFVWRQSSGRSWTCLCVG